MDLSAGTDAGTVRDELIAALTSGDANLAEIIALDAVANGMPVTDLYVDAIAPALAEIGHQWATRKLSVADEHLATGIAHDVMRLVSRTATAYPRRSRERSSVLRYSEPSKPYLTASMRDALSAKVAQPMMIPIRMPATKPHCRMIRMIASSDRYSDGDNRRRDCTIHL